MKKITLYLFTFLAFSAMVHAQNIINSSDWIAGTSGSTTNFNMLGTEAQNTRVNMAGPYGEQVVAWKAMADGSNGLNGGFMHKSGVDLSTTKCYRVSYWVNSEGPNDCGNVVGFIPYEEDGYPRITNFLNSAGNVAQYPFFSTIDLPNDQWYLVVGYVYPYPTSEHTTFEGGVINPTTGLFEFGVSDFIYPDGYDTIQINIRALLWSCGAGETMYVYDPRIEELNGSETPLEELITGNPSTDPDPDPDPDTDPDPTPTTSLWTQNGDHIYYNDANGGGVAIGINNPGNYLLAVNGHLRAREIRVDTDIWPDYVFKTNYKLPTLDAVKKHIDEKGHLINIPSAAQIQTNGLQLGEMNTLLLEKVEELTLYILELEEGRKRLTELFNIQDQKLIELEKRLEKLNTNNTKD